MDNESRRGMEGLGGWRVWVSVVFGEGLSRNRVTTEQVTVPVRSMRMLTVVAFERI